MPVKNKAVDLQNFLFGQLERLDNPELTPEELDREIARSKSMCDIAGKLNETASLALKAEELRCEYALKDNEKPLAGYLGNS